jgi:hypothetical protein
MNVSVRCKTRAWLLRVVRPPEHTISDTTPPVIVNRAISAITPHTKVGPFKARTGRGSVPAKSKNKYFSISAGKYVFA